MKLITSLTAVCLLLFLIPNSSRASEDIVASCDSAVAPEQVVNFSDEISRRWQLAFAEDIQTIREKKGKLSSKSKVGLTNIKIRNVLFKLRSNRAEATRENSKSYRTALLSCLDQENKKVYQTGINQALVDFRSSIKPIKTEMVENKRAFKRSAKLLIRKLKKRGISRRVFEQKKTELVAARVSFLKEVKSRVDQLVTERDQKLLAAKTAFDSQAAQNSGISDQRAAALYQPVIDRIKKDEPGQIKKTFQNTRGHISVLNRRARKDPMLYGAVESGPPTINFKQATATPSMVGSRSLSLIGRKRVRVAELKLMGSGDILVVGDSISLGMKGYLEKAFPEGIDIDHNAVGGYNSIQIYGLFASSYKSKKHSVIIFDAGTNDNPNYPSILKSQLQKVASRVGPRRCIIVPTVNTLIVGGVGASGKNQVIRDFANSRPLTFAPNWAGKSSGLMYDSLHPNSEGNRVRAEMLSDAVKKCFA